MDPPAHALAPDPVHLRPYQAQACEAAWTTLEGQRGALVSSPTGTGKTVMLGAVARRAVAECLRVLLVVHGDHLVKQNAEALQVKFGLLVDIEQARHHAKLAKCYPTAQVVVASIDSIQLRYGRFARDAFDLIIIDEGHRGIAEGYLATYAHFQDAKLLAFTATPERRDAKDLLDVFETLCFEYTTPQAIMDGWLVAPLPHVIKIGELDLSEVRKRNGDLIPSSLRALMTVEAQTKIIQPTVELMGARSTMVFTVDVEAAHVAAELIPRFGPFTAAAVDGKFRGRRRHRVENDFRAGKLHYLCNCAVFVEGFDAPRMLGMCMGRMTTSWGRYMQMLGRSLRPWPGIVDGIESAAARREAIAHSPKPHAVIVDPVDASGRHDLIRPCDVIDPDMDPEEREAVLAKMEEDEQIPLPDLIASVDREIALRAAREAELANIEYQVKIRTFASMRNPDLQTTLEFYDVKKATDRWNRTATPNMVDALRRFGIAADRNTDWRQAHSLLDRLVGRAKARLASPGMVRTMLQKGISPGEAMSLTHEQANRKLVDLARSNRKNATWNG